MEKLKYACAYLCWPWWIVAMLGMHQGISTEPCFDCSLVPSYGGFSFPKNDSIYIDIQTNCTIIISPFSILLAHNFVNNCPVKNYTNFNFQENMMLCIDIPAAVMDGHGVDTNI